jgi:hypothetical protein
MGFQASPDKLPWRDAISRMRGNGTYDHQNSYGTFSNVFGMQ